MPELREYTATDRDAPREYDATLRRRILESLFSVTIQSTNSPITGGETLDVQTLVEETGSLDDTQDITLDIDGVGQVDVESVSLNADGTATITLSWATETGDAGDYTAMAASEDDTDSVSVTVEASFTEDLYALYDAQSLSLSDGETVSDWSDDSGNGYDLSASGAPEYIESGYNDNPSVNLDGVDDYFIADTWDDLSQPFTVYSVFVDDAGDDNEIRRLWTNDDTGDRSIFWKAGSTLLYRMFSGNTLEGGNTGNIATTVHDGSNSLMELDGTQVISGDAGAQGLGSFRVGSQSDDTRFWDGLVCEIRIYNARHDSSTRSEIYDVLADKWS